jgi:D-3-phosphoglycerate dehydrogenase / 2-oxoglutarate reductase
MAFEILTLNNIAAAGLDRLPRERYEITSEIREPDAVLVRSADMHELTLPPSLKAVGRAGVGVNNIPVDAFSKRGVPVFNAPGANANAVKELVLAGLLLAARQVCVAWEFVRGLEGDDETLDRIVEKEKKRFVGFELPGKCLGVVGLGAVGVEVANSALALGMKVLGYDPQLTVQRAWQLSASVEQAMSLDHLFARANAITLHTPLTPQTRGLVNTQRLALMQPGGVLLNLARAGVVDEAAVLAALDDGRLLAYVTDFPTRALKDHPRVTALPHLGASTGESEVKCAVMVADSVREFLEDGNIRNSVNFPEVLMPRAQGYRLGVANANVPNMVGQITTRLAEAGLNIIDLINKSRSELAYTLVDVETPIPQATFEQISGIEGVLSARLID